MRTATPPAVDVHAFDGLDVGYTQLAIPAGTRDVYMRSAGWRDFFKLDNVLEQGTNIRATDVYRHEGDDNPEWQYRMFGDFVPGTPVLSCAAGKNAPVGPSSWSPALSRATMLSSPTVRFMWSTRVRSCPPQESTA